MAQRTIKVGNITDISGQVNIAGGDIGYTAEQVSVLLAQITSGFQPKPFDGRCPYKGLDVFEEEDAELFFGREKLVTDLVSRVKQSRTVFITGPSGSGKSSLVRAGLIPALKNGAISELHSERWLYETLKPGRDPLGELARVAASLAGNLTAGDDIRTKGLKDPTILAKWGEISLKEGRDKRALLFVDQFEEVFTQVGKQDERQAFLNLLTYAANDENGRMIVLFSMRSDFVPNCASYPQINDLLNRQFVQIGAMQTEELVSAIAQPALRVGLRIDPALVAQIINDMKGEPGTLPLMQFALKDLFDAQQAKGGFIALTLNDYLQRGGIYKSLERHADEAFTRLSKDEQELAHSIFSGLIEIGRGTQDTRRTALFDELVPVDGKATEVETVVQKLADARLISTDKNTITISHEKLIDAWPWLRKLVNDNRDAIALQNEIASNAEEWSEHKRDASYLYTGARLSNVREQMEAKKILLSGTANAFVRAGLVRHRRNQVALIGGISTVIALLIMAVIIFNRQSSANAQLAQQNAAIANTAQAASTAAVAGQNEAQQQARIAQAGELAAQSVSEQDKNPILSFLLGIEAYKRFDTVRTRGVLLKNILTKPQLLQFLNKHTGSVLSVAFSPDGKMLASGSEDNTIILWDVATRQPIGQPLIGHASSVFSVAFSPDGKMLASGSGDSTIILWDVATRQPIGQPLIGHNDVVLSVAFSPNGKTLASGSSDTAIILWDVVTHQPIDQKLNGHSSIFSVAFSPNGKMLASGDYNEAITLWDVATRQPIGQPLTGHTSYVSSVAFSPDGKMLASGSNDNTIILWDVATHQPIGKPLTGHTETVHSVIFSPDGKMLASGSEDNTIILWDVATRQSIGEPLTGHTAKVASVAFSPDGKTLASGSEDKTIILWDVGTAQPIGQPLTGHKYFVNSVAFSPDGKTLASGSSDTAIILWDVATRQPIGQPLTGHTGGVESVAFSPDGKTLASGSDDGTIILWDVATRQSIGQPLTGHTAKVASVAFSPDGKTLASGSEDKTIILWDVGTAQPIGQPLTGHKYFVNSVAFSPDGKTLASGSSEPAIILWDVATRQPIGQPLTGHTGGVESVSFSPDGKTLASGSADGTIILWNVATHQPISQPLTGDTSIVSSVTFSPDSKTLASGSWDNTIILWDVATRQPIGQPLTEYTKFLSVAFSPDGMTLASGSDDRTVFLWDVDPGSWVNRTCQRAGRNLTRSEWAQYFSLIPYPTRQADATCPQWPLEP